MARIFCAIVMILGLSSCIQPSGLLIPMSVGITPYGRKFDVGERLDCGCFEVESFAEDLRSKPRARGIDSYIGYLDYGWMGIGQPWVVLPGDHAETGQLSSEIRAFDPAHKKIWDETKLLSGNTAPGVVFEAYIPAIADRPSPNAWVTKREAVLLRGVILERCDKRLLLMRAIRDYPPDDWLGEMADLSRQRSRDSLARFFDEFLANIYWKPDA